MWPANDHCLQCPVAMKTVRLPAADPRAARVLALLREEAALLARLRQPNVVKVRTWRQAGADRYLVTEYVPGGSLADRLATGPIPWDKAVRFTADTGDGLAAVHVLGVVHRDVKPDNVLWDDAADEAGLTDFGVSA